MIKLKAKILNQNANEIWLSGLENSSKNQATKNIKGELLFCYDEIIRGKPEPFLVTHICDHPVYKWAQVVDLRFDCEKLFTLSFSELKAK